DVVGAWKRAEEFAVQVKQSGFTRFPLARFFILIAQGFAGLLALRHPDPQLPDPAALKKTIQDSIRGLAKMKQGSSWAVCAHMEAALAAWSGETEAALVHLADAEQRFTAFDQKLYALSCAVHAAQLRGEDTAPMMARLAEAGSRDPVAWLRAYAPTFPATTRSK
ncbi:MAG: hypothetical protein ACI8RZ_000488, partial [Myxococcota bacterium]